MARLVIIILCILLFTTSFANGHRHHNKGNKSVENITEAPELVCGDNEIQDNCPLHCPSDYCPESRYEDQSACPEPPVCPPPACKCQFNHRRANNGTCIPTRDCPAFPCTGHHESYNPCPSYCPGENCSEATPDGECHLPGLFLPVVNCKPACRCDKTYWRLNGKCVPYNKCPNVTTTTSTIIKSTTPRSKTKTTEASTQATSSTPSSIKCDNNEIVDECPFYCPSDYCPKNRYDDQVPCPIPKKCPAPACKCAFNYRRAINGTCIPTRSCPPFQCDGKNEVYDSCPPYCPGQSCSQATPDGNCHIFGYIGIVLQCEPACRCKMNYWRLNGTCVPYSQCQNQNNTMNTTTAGTTNDNETNTNSCRLNSSKCVNGCNRGTNDRDNHSSESDCGCDESDINVCECNQDPDCGCNNAESIDSNSRDGNDQDTIPNKSDCGCDGTDINVCECNQDPDCGCNDAESIDSNSRDGNDQDTIPNESDCGCDETDINVCECNQDPDCGCKDSSSREQYEGDHGCETTSSPPPTCEDSEILDNCPIDCPSDYCPKSRYHDQSACPKPLNCPPPACKCRFNYRRAENGTCIPIESCPPFECKGCHEQYNACPTYCPGESCINATPDGECYTIGNIYVAVACKPACTCKKTYWRLGGTCVPYAECRECLNDNSTDGTFSITNCE